MIPEEAIEAATDALQQFALNEDRDGLQAWDAYARAAIEAAVPRLLSNAWERGYRDCGLEWEQTADLATPDEDRFVATNPYEATK